jgi:hypothetical protein
MIYRLSTLRGSGSNRLLEPPAYLAGRLSRSMAAGRNSVEVQRELDGSMALRL